jgi:hypothetical protein
VTLQICPIRIGAAGLQPMTSIATQTGVLSVAFDHSRLYAGCEDPVIRQWDFDNNKETFFDKEAWRQAMQMLDAKRQGTAPKVMCSKARELREVAARAANLRRW